MGRTIPSIRIAALMEEKRWKTYRQYLYKHEQKIFKHMFSIALYHQKKILSLKKKLNKNFFSTVIVVYD
jgi:hypothetical protein